MKILTNIQKSNLSGIAQIFATFVEYLRKSKTRNVSIVGVNVLKSMEPTEPKVTSKDIYKIIELSCRYQPIDELAKASKKLDDIFDGYTGLIENYKRILVAERPDLILLNGTYFAPWCLYMASQGMRLPSVLHYYGILSKERAHRGEQPRKLLEEMEKSFDDKNMFYIFPSNLSKETVENEVYGHKVKRFTVLPNPIPDYFFDIGKKGNSRKIGIVSRWTWVKNLTFIRKFASYNQKQKDHFVINMVTDLRKDSCTAQKMSQQIKFIKPMPNCQLPNFFAKMGIVLSPSLFETYGNVAQEALAANTPALVSPNMGVAETFRKFGLSDWVVNFDSVKNIYDLSTGIIGQEVKKTIRQEMQDELSASRICGQMFGIIKSI